MELINIYSNNCFNCHYIELLMKKIGVYDKIKHIEKNTTCGTNLIDKYSISSIPTLLVLKNDNLIAKYENMERETIERIKRAYRL